MKLKKVASLALVGALVVSNLSGLSGIKNAMADESFKNSLITQLKFDDSLDDSKGSNNGTGNKAVTYVDGVDGKAVSLDGSTYIDLGKSTDLQPENLTFSTWIKVDGELSGENMITWFKPSGAYQGKGWYLASLDNSTPLKISVGESTGQPMEAYVSAKRSEFFPSGEWVHIAVTFNSENQQVGIYRNGVSQEVLYLNTLAYITKDDSSNKYIGFNSPGYNSGFAKLCMDDTRFYSSVATPADVLGLYTEFGADFDVQSLVDSDYESLSLSVKNVKYDITLPTEGKAGSTITWKSSNTSVLANDGKVTRPALGEADEVITLTAEVSYTNAQSKTKEFKLTVPAKSDFKNLSDFDMSDVEILDDYLTNAQELEIKYLKSFEVDRLLKGFATIAGKESDAKLYDGWENSAIKGHTLGHYLTAISQAYATTGDSEILETINYMIDKLSEYQLDSGYLAAIPESHYEQIENGNTSGTWVPWYTMHKVMAGLIDAYELAGNEKALTVATKLGDWVYSRTSKWTDATKATVLAVEYGGMNDCLYNLYAITKNANHLSAAHSFDEMTLFDPLYNGEDVLNGKHANTTIPKIIGALNRYLVLDGRNADEAVAASAEEAYYLKVAENFWEIVKNNHSYITGGNSEWEHFGQAGILDGERTNCNCETCNTYNMLKLTRELYKITGDAKYADYYENTFINAILSSQNPETGMTTYFQPMATGYFKVYGSEFNHFWCCTGSGMENFSKLGDSIYYHNETDIYVIQYLSSVVTFTEKNIKITQETKIPETDTAKFTINTLDGKTSDAVIKLRIPDWVSGDVTVTVNGTKEDVKIAGGVVTLKKEWNDKDVIEITLPMEAVAYDLPDNSNVIAIKYGPIVLSASLGTEDMVTTTTGVNVTIPTRNVKYVDTIYVVNSTVSDWVSNIAKNVVKVDGKLEFSLKGTDSDDLVFSPHYMQHTDRYGIYFKYSSTTGASSDEGQKDILESKEKARFEAATIDSVPVSNDQYELQHNMLTDKSSTGSFNGLMYRDASAGGYFQYEMKVDSSVKNYLVVNYFSGDAGRAFTIYANDKVLKEVTLEDVDPDNFYQVSYELPQDVVKGNETVTIKFAADKNSLAGGIFDRVYILREYTANATFKDIVVDDESLSKIDNEEIKAYVDESLEKVSVKFDLTDANGLLYVNDVLVDDTRAQEIKLDGDTTQVKLVVKAENHETQKEYTFKIIKGEEPSNMVMIIIIIVAVVVIAGVGVFVVIKKKK